MRQSDLNNLIDLITSVMAEATIIQEEAESASPSGLRRIADRIEGHTQLMLMMLDVAPEDLRQSLLRVNAARAAKNPAA